MHNYLSKTLVLKMKLEKILESISSAINNLEESVEAFEQNEETEVMNNVWRAAADLEYALFLFSLKHQDETRRSSWKLDPHPKQVEIKPLLMSAKNLLRTAKENIKTKNFLEAHKNAWIARGHLLRIHDAFEKKRKSGK